MRWNTLDDFAMAERVVGEDVEGQDVGANGGAGEEDVARALDDAWMKKAGDARSERPARETRNRRTVGVQETINCDDATLLAAVDDVGALGVEGLKRTFLQRNAPHLVSSQRRDDDDLGGLTKSTFCAWSLVT